MAEARVPRVFASAGARRRFVFQVLALTGVLVGLSVFAYYELAFLYDPAAARAFISQFGRWGPAVLVGLHVLQIVFAPIPGQVLGVAGGYLYGIWVGTLLNVLGVAIGSTIAFWVGRRFGRSYVEGIVDADALERFDGVSDRRAMVALFAVFLVPGLPDDVVCFAGGLTDVKLRYLVVLAVVGRTPSFFAANVFGELVGTGQMVAAGVLLVVASVLTGLGYRYRGRLLALLDGEGPAEP